MSCIFDHPTPHPPPPPPPPPHPPPPPTPFAQLSPGMLLLSPEIGSFSFRSSFSCLEAFEGRANFSLLRCVVKRHEGLIHPLRSFPRTRPSCTVTAFLLHSERFLIRDSHLPQASLLVILWGYVPVFPLPFLSDFLLFLFSPFYFLSWGCFAPDCNLIARLPRDGRTPLPPGNCSFLSSPILSSHVFSRFSRSLRMNGPAPCFLALPPFASTCKNHPHD